MFIILYSKMTTNNELFIMACRNGDLSRVINLYNLTHVDDFAINNEAFYGACINGHVHIVKYLFTLPNISFKQKRYRAFHIVCINNYLELAKFLCKQNDKEGFTDYDCWFKIALDYNNKSIAEFIIRNYNVVIENDDCYKQQYDDIISSMNIKQLKSAAKT